MNERRGWPRIHYARGILPPGVRVHPNRDVIMVNLSRSGALIEGVWRFTPRAAVSLLVQRGAGVLQARGIVERCFVQALERGGSVRYRAAIRFEVPLSVDPPEDGLVGTG
jgi:hypothetical protein